jgi:transcription elongation factor Elf1
LASQQRQKKKRIMTIKIGDMNPEKAIFTTHVNARGQLKDGKERFECGHCGGKAFIHDSIVLPNGVQHYTFQCTDCNEEWNESY